MAGPDRVHKRADNPTRGLPHLGRVGVDAAVAREVFLVGHDTRAIGLDDDIQVEIDEVDFRAGRGDNERRGRGDVALVQGRGNRRRVVVVSPEYVVHERRHA